MPRGSCKMSVSTETNLQTSEIGKPLSSSHFSRDGLLVINADDWGMDIETTSRILECVVHGTVSSVSAMVFMQDSERAAHTARHQNVDAGLHLNLTSPFSDAKCPARLSQHQQRLCRYLRRYRFAQVVFHPTLRNSFKYVVSAQLEEFNRLYGTMPKRIDGHHHMHLCANVLLSSLLPPSTVVRRSFSFEKGEKSFANRMYRQAINGVLARKHRLTDYFYSLAPLDPPARLQGIFGLAEQFAVEVETHPANPDEYGFLTGCKIGALIGNVRIARGYHLPLV
jgi:chitin disaccharide deacetylase